MASILFFFMCDKGLKKSKDDFAGHIDDCV